MRAVRTLLQLARFSYPVIIANCLLESDATHVLDVVHEGAWSMVEAFLFGPWPKIAAESWQVENQNISLNSRNW